MRQLQANTPRGFGGDESSEAVALGLPVCAQPLLGEASTGPFAQELACNLVWLSLSSD